jgi:predicted PurR-regulated permease PerM
MIGTGAANGGDGHRPDAAAAERSQRAAWVVLALLLGGVGLWVLWSFLPALLWAAVFAVATWPLYHRFAAFVARSWRGEFAALAFTLAVALVFILPLAAAAIEVGREAVVLVRWAADAVRSGLPVPEGLVARPFLGGWASRWWQENLSDPEAIRDLFRHLDREALVSWTRIVGAQLVHRALIFVFTLLTLFFLFRDGPALAAQLRGLARRTFGARAERLGRDLVATLRGTVNGIVLVGLGEGLLLGVAYALAGLPHAGLLAALSAVLATIPFGAPLVFGAGALTLLVEGHVAAAAALAGWGMAVTFIADHFVRPALIGGSARLPFILVLLGILGGIETMGLLGLFLGPAIMAAVVTLWRDLADSETEPYPEP